MATLTAANKDAKYEELIKDFEIDDTVDLNTICNKVQYVRNLKSSCGLHVMKPKICKNSWCCENHEGLFKIFLNNSFLYCVYKWTNIELEKNGHNQMSRKEFNSYIGLEIAMSLNSFNQLKDYWSTKTFLGNIDFKHTMG